MGMLAKHDFAICRPDLLGAGAPFKAQRLVVIAFEEVVHGDPGGFAVAQPER